MVFKNFFSKHLLMVIFLIVIICSSIITISIVNDRAKPMIDVSSLYENITEYNFEALSENVIVSSSNNIAKFSWDANCDKFYVRSFDGGVGNAPSNEFQDKAVIPKGTKKIQVDATVAGTYNDLPLTNFDAHMYLITYNENGQVDNENIKLIFDSKLERGRNRSITIKVKDSAISYKIIFRVNPSIENYSAGTMSISNLDVLFY